METNDQAKSGVSRREFLLIAGAAALSTDRGAAQFTRQARRVYVVPNFHPASCGWLATFSMERVYCANSYFDHLDRVRDDPDYAFVLSEVNNMIAMMNFKPERIPELKSRIREGRVELVNGFFLESTINLSGGEALVRLGVEGLRWQRKMLGVRPRFAWTIDVCGTHDQMAQIASGLGLEAMVYTRKNPTGSAVHWSVSPDGSKLLSLCPGPYAELRPVMRTEQPLGPAQLDEVEKSIDDKLKITPENAPILILAGTHDYSLAPLYKNYPQEFLRQWKEKPDRPEVRFSILSNYLNELQELDRRGRLKIPTMLGGTAYDFDAFWIECPRVKGWFRKCEHLLHAAESVATLASLRGNHAYPSEQLYNAWTLLFLSMDRNTLWGSAGGMVFESEKSWDVSDRLDWIEKHASSAAEEAGKAVIPVGEDVAVYNPLNWSRRDPVVLLKHAFDGDPGQRLGDAVLCQPEMPSLGLVGLKKAVRVPAEAKEVPLPPILKTKQYELKINPETGAIDSLKLRAGDKEVLAGAANVVIAEKPKTQKGDPGDFIVPRPQRERLDSTSEHPQKIHVLRGPIATTVTIEGEFLGGGLCRRTVTLYDDYPRIDLTTELNDLPNLTVVVAEFPLAGAVDEVRRGIPYGFSHGAWAKPNPDLHGWTKGIVPAVRWSHYSLSSGGGVALLDRGLTGREINENTPIIYLYNATDKYYEFLNPWLSGKGRHVLEYALVAHEGTWKEARIPHLAWEFNSPPVVISGRATAPKSYLKTSSNIVVESLRRVADDIELRFVECLGYPGTAEITLLLPHLSANRTDMNGEHGKPLTGGPTYRLPVHPQEIVTLRFRTGTRVAEPELITQWDAMVPPDKLPMLYRYSSEKGLPPKGDGTFNQ